MCILIAVGLHPKASQKWVANLPRPMHSVPAHYEGLASAMHNFSVSLIITSMCSCDLFNRGSQESSTAKYRKKGWSDSKIARAIANQQKANLHAGLHPDFRQWLPDAATESGGAYLFIHWDSDALAYHNQLSITDQELREQSVAIKEEQLIHIHPR